MTNTTPSTRDHPADSTIAPERAQVPPGRELDRSARFWDRMANRYARQPVADEQAYKNKLHVTQRYWLSDMQVFEFGCGTGSTAIAHAPHVKHIRAIDFSQKMVDIARAKAERAEVHNVTFEKSSIDVFDAEENAFDAVLGLNILHLLDDRELAIDKVNRLLKPGGLFVTSTVCLANSVWWIKTVLPLGHRLGFFPLVRSFSAGDLDSSLTRHGFEIDYRWQPGESKSAFQSVFIVARKSGRV